MIYGFTEISSSESLPLIFFNATEACLTCCKLNYCIGLLNFKTSWRKKIRTSQACMCLKTRVLHPILLLPHFLDSLSASGTASWPQTKPAHVGNGRRGKLGSRKLESGDPGTATRFWGGRGRPQCLIWGCFGMWVITNAWGGPATEVGMICYPSVSHLHRGVHSSPVNVYM